MVREIYKSLIPPLILICAGLERHLLGNAHLMYNLFLAIRARGTPPTTEEIAIAKKEKQLSHEDLHNLINTIGPSENIISAFARQENAKQVCIYLIFPVLLVHVI